MKFKGKRKRRKITFQLHLVWHLTINTILSKKEKKTINSVINIIFLKKSGSLKEVRPCL
jgi:hypothetical protein